MSGRGDREVSARAMNAKRGRIWQRAEQQGGLGLIEDRRARVRARARPGAENGKFRKAVGFLDPVEEGKRRGKTSNIPGGICWFK